MGEGGRDRGLPTIGTVVEVVGATKLYDMAVAARARAGDGYPGPISLQDQQIEGDPLFGRMSSRYIPYRDNKGGFFHTLLTFNEKGLEHNKGFITNAERIKIAEYLKEKGYREAGKPDNSTEVFTFLGNPEPFRMHYGSPTQEGLEAEVEGAFGQLVEKSDEYPGMPGGSGLYFTPEHAASQMEHFLDESHPNVLVDFTYSPDPRNIEGPKDFEIIAERYGKFYEDIMNAFYVAKGIQPPFRGIRLTPAEE